MQVSLYILLCILLYAAAFWRNKRAIASKIKRAIKHKKTSPARHAQLLQPSLAFCFSLQPMTAYRPGLDGIRRHWPQAKRKC